MVRLNHRCVLSLVLAALCPALCPAAQPRDPATVKQHFDMVMSRLDPGGDLLLVASVEGVLENLAGLLSQAVAAAPAGDAGAEAARQFVAKLPEFLRQQGVFAVRGLGVSTVPRGDGLSNVKCFVSRDPGAAKLPLWRGLVGGAPRRVAAVGYLPADTVLVRAFSAELNQLWALLRQSVKELAAPEQAADFEAGLGRAATELGVGIDELMASLGDEGFLSLQFAPDATVALPSPGGMFNLPRPSLLAGLAVKNDRLLSLLEAQFAKNGMPLVKTQVAGATLSSVNLPLPSPVPVQPTFTVHNGYLLIGSSPEVVTAALGAATAGNGLAASDAFKQAFPALPEAHNGIFYVSPRFGAFLADLQSQAIANVPATDPGAQPMMELLKGINEQRGTQTAAFVFVNAPDGVLMSGVSSATGRELAAGSLAAPVGLLAAIAIPSFVKARDTSQHNACINNLRQIDAAKEQWAMAQLKEDGDPVEEQGMVQYIKGAALPVCPKGGIYTVGPIGVDPRCSIPGHALP